MVQVHHIDIQLWFVYNFKWSTVCKLDNVARDPVGVELLQGDYRDARTRDYD